MNVKEILTRSINRAGIAVGDLSVRNMSLGILNEIIDEHWESKHWGFRKRDSSIATAASTDEYALDKLVRVQDIVPHTMRGSDPVRKLNFEPSHDFHKRRPYQLEGSDPYYYRPGSMRGYSTNPSSASVISFVSSLTNYTTGTVNVVNGSKRVVIATGVVGVDDVGKYIRIDSDTKAYRIERIEHNSTSVFFINDPYEGTNDSSASYTIGDVGQKVSVFGYVSGQLTEEVVQLNGSTSVSTTKSFTSIERISKDFTHGYITATSNSGGVTNAVLDPGESELDVQTIKLYPIPTKVETINFESYIKHPNLYAPSDSPLFPKEFHNLLVIELYIRLEEEWNRSQVPASVYARRDKILFDMEAIDNNTDQWVVQQENYEESDRHRISNLPTTYEDDGFF